MKRWLLLFMIPLSLEALEHTHPVFSAIEAGNETEVRRQFLVHDTDANIRLASNGDTPLIFAVRQANLLLVKYDQKIFTDPVTIEAAYKKSIEIVRFLLYLPHIQIKAENNGGETALSLASQEGLSQIVELIISRIRAAHFAGDETAGYMRQLEELGVPDIIHAKLLAAIEKYGSSEHPSDMAVQNSYLKTLFALPWNTQSNDVADIAQIYHTLEAEHFGLKKIKEKILGIIALKILSPSHNQAHSTILCLVGPPGVGKTSLAESIAHALGKEFVRVSLGGVTEERAIRGLNKGYVGAEPGDIIKALKTAQTRNPVILLDEIDKLDHSVQHGDPAAALLEVLDPKQNRAFLDHYIDIPFDLSHVFFIVTANDASTISPTLRDRLEIIQLSSYTFEEKLEIVKQHIAKRLLIQTGLDQKGLSFSDELLQAIITRYTKEAGVRRLEQHIKTLCQKAARAYLETGTMPLFTPDTVALYLGAPMVDDTIKSFITDSIGVALGLAWTPVGGNMLPVEATKYPGTGQIKLTGQLGDVLKESAHIALSYLRTHAVDLHISNTVFTQYDFHIHLPEGATHKDGPSAGVTLVSALASLLMERKYNSTYAMTGEISLTGKVLPIGGLKEKLLAAKKQGISTVIIPMENKADLDECKELFDGMHVVLIASLDDLLEKVLLPKE